MVKILNKISKKQAHSDGQGPAISSEPAVPVQPAATPPRSGKLRHYIGMSLTAMVIFAFGYMVGGGRISLHSNNLASRNTGLPANLDYSSVEVIYDSLRDNFDGQLEEAKLLDGIKGGLAQATGDPYTDYFDPKEATAFTNELDGT